jgi:hypothetical protein
MQATQHQAKRNSHKVKSPFYAGKLAPSEKKLASSLDKQLAIELGGGLGSTSGSLEDTHPLTGEEIPPHTQLAICSSYF